MKYGLNFVYFEFAEPQFWVVVYGTENYLSYLIVDYDLFTPSFPEQLLFIGKHFTINRKHKHCTYILTAAMANRTQAGT